MGCELESITLCVIHNNRNYIFASDIKHNNIMNVMRENTSTDFEISIAHVGLVINIIRVY